MKKTSISISLESEKLSVLKLYMKQKSISLEDELVQASEALYTKYVPVNVREFIGLRSEIKTPTEGKKKPQPQSTGEPSEDRGDSD